MLPRDESERDLEANVRSSETKTAKWKGERERGKKEVTESE